MDIKIYTDGGSLGNPGPSASAYVIYLDDKIIFKEGKRIGYATNNRAEYMALIFALEKVRSLIAEGKLEDVEVINVISDSNLLVQQVNGIFKVKNADIRENIMKIRILEQEVGIPIVYAHTLREGNSLADSLVKEVLATSR